MNVAWSTIAPYMTIELGLQDGDFVEIKLSDDQIAAAAKAIAKAEAAKVAIGAKT